MKKPIVFGIAILIVAISSGALTQSPRIQDIPKNDPTSTSQGTNQPHSEPANPPAPISDPVNKPEKTPESADQTGDRKQDCPNCDARNLDQQIRIADSSERQLTVSIFGTVFLALTLIATAWAAWAASVAARAAKDAVGMERAWITMSDLSPHQATNIETETGIHKEGFVFIIKWKNSGRTPALRVESWRDFKIVPYDSEDIPSFEYKSPVDIISHTIIGPDMGGEAAPIPIVGIDYDSMVARKSKIFICGITRYYDIFNSSIAHTTECCVQVIYNGSQRTPDGRKFPHFDISPRGPQNTAI